MQPASRSSTALPRAYCLLRSQPRIGHAEPPSDSEWDYLDDSNCTMVMEPFTLSAENLIFSPSFIWSSQEGSLTRNTIVIPGMPRLLRGPWVKVTFPADLSTFLTSPS